MIEVIDRPLACDLECWTVESRARVGAGRYADAVACDYCTSEQSALDVAEIQDRDGRLIVAVVRPLIECDVDYDALEDGQCRLLSHRLADAARNEFSLAHTCWAAALDTLGTVTNEQFLKYANKHAARARRFAEMFEACEKVRQVNERKTLSKSAA